MAKSTPLSADDNPANCGEAVAASFLGIPIFSQKIGVSNATAYRHVSSGLIRSIRLGRRRLIPIEELDRLREQASFRESPEECTQIKKQV